jgi:hypothetical protein
LDKIINKAPIIGFVRYSQKIKFGNRKNEKDVFEAEYFEYRFNIFKNVTLKSFQQQSNSNFVLLLLHSENMPLHYKERFIELEKANAFLHNVFVKDTQEAFNESILNSVKYVSFEKEVAVTFRIDNDDAVQNNFIEKLSGFLKADFVGYTVSIPIMNIVKRISEKSYLLQESYFPANAIGLAYVTPIEKYKTVFNLGDHDLVNNQNGMVVLAECTSGGLMTINGENEINAIDKTRAITLNKESLDKYLVERKIENLDLECLRIYHEEKNFSEFFQLFVPPLFHIISRKIKNYFLKTVNIK